MFVSQATKICSENVYCTKVVRENLGKILFAPHKKLLAPTPTFNKITNYLNNFNLFFKMILGHTDESRTLFSCNGKDLPLLSATLTFPKMKHALKMRMLLQFLISKKAGSCQIYCNLH